VVYFFTSGGLLNFFTPLIRLVGSAVKVFTKDPRHYQIFVLFCVTSYGYFFGGFNLNGTQILLTVTLAQLFQYLAVRLVKIPFDPLSCVISSLSLCILLRSDSWFWIVVVIAITIFSKFLIRYNNKHIFNPTNFSLAVGMLLSDKVWMSPGQWGTQPFLIFFLMAMGGIILTRSRTSDVTIHNNSNLFCIFFSSLK